MKHEAKPPDFFERYALWLVVSQIANELGSEVMAILLAVAKSEKDIGYRGPVAIHNAQVMASCGYKKWSTLDRNRDKAIAAGWLLYEGPPSGTKAPGFYSLTVPKEWTTEHIPKSKCTNEHVPKWDTVGDTVGDNILQYVLDNGSKKTEERYPIMVHAHSNTAEPKKKTGGVFDWLPEDMHDIGKLIEWHKRASNCPRPVIGKTPDDRLTVIAAAVHCWNKGNDTKRLFCWIIGKKRYDTIDDEAMEAANRLIQQHLTGRTGKPTRSGTPFDREVVNDVLVSLGVTV